MLSPLQVLFYCFIAFCVFFHALVSPISKICFTFCVFLSTQSPCLRIPWNSSCSALYFICNWCLFFTYRSYDNAHYRQPQHWH